jgi:putative ABC transport system ATP-binding protein
MNESAEPLFHTEDLWKIYPDGDVTALAGVDLTIRKGEYAAITGPSGCGKSTLLNLLGALDRPTRGEVYFLGQPLSKVPDLDSIRSHKIGFVFQSFHLLPTLSVEENVQVPMFEGPLGIKDRAKKAHALLDLVGLSHRLGHLPGQLSVGERQRVAIARSLANDPVVILADEPTGNLDSRNAADVLDLFDRLNRDRGTTLVIITHSEECAARASREVRMRDGKVLGEADHPH